MWKCPTERNIFFAIAIVAIAGCSGGQKTEENNAPPPGGNTAPTISGSPIVSVGVGTAYSFTPNANDADGDTLTFSVQNLPTWASFDTGNGEVSGTPQSGDVFTYTDISISVSDGQANASLAPFEIDVLAQGNLTATLSWTAPTQNSDNTPLLDLAGYRVSYGLSLGAYPNFVDGDNPGISTVMVQNLTPNTYYFVVSAVNGVGVASDYSNVAVITLQ